jgi:hypothetical protein
MEINDVIDRDVATTVVRDKLNDIVGVSAEVDYGRSQVEGLAIVGAVLAREKPRIWPVVRSTVNRDGGCRDGSNTEQYNSERTESRE